MSQGFVYVLGNECLPGLYKIGFTDRSPSARCAELSAATAIPNPFKLICYAEFQNASRKARAVHAELAKYRVTHNREFFRAPLREIAELVLYSGEELTTCEHELAVWEWEFDSRSSPALRVVGGFE